MSKYLFFHKDLIKKASIIVASFVFTLANVEAADTAKQNQSTPSEVTIMIDNLPSWDNFNYKNKDALSTTVKAFSSLPDSVRNAISSEKRDKLNYLKDKVEKSTIQNLESSLKVKHSYQFNFASSDGHFDESQMEYLHFIADCLKMNPNAKVSIIGYTCNVGSEVMNEVFGYDRAIHVRNYLLRYGASEDQVIMDTKTSKNPIAPNDCEKNRAKNRRTEIKLIKK